MLPDGRLSTTPVVSEIMGGKANSVGRYTDYEDGGINIQDNSEGISYQIWTANTNGNDIILDAPNQASPTIIYTGTAITDLRFTFDSNMNPHAVFRENDVPSLLWYDTTIPGQSVDTFSWDSASIFLDDKRSSQTGISDIILFYIENENLYSRLQRDRFEVEYLLKAAIGDRKLITVGMGFNLRLQIVMTGLDTD